MPRTLEELRTQINEKIATFNVGDEILFSLYDDNLEIPLTGIITSINNQHATVTHQYGQANVWLNLAKKVNHVQNR